MTYESFTQRRKAARKMEAMRSWRLCERFKICNLFSVLINSMRNCARSSKRVIFHKRQLVIIIWVLALVSGGFCVTAPPGHLIELSQPDGTQFVAQVRGDEFCHWLEDPQGYPIVRVMPAKEYRYAIIDSTGTLQPSEFPVGKVDPRLQSLRPYIIPNADIIRA